MVSLKIAAATLLLSAGLCVAQETVDPYKIVTNPNENIDSMTISGKEQIDCSWIAKRNPIVILAMGQSLIGNSNGSAPWEQRINRNVYEHWGTRCYKASEPIYGAADVHRSFVFQLADLIARATKQDVVINMAAVGGASIERFLPNGDVHRIWTDQIKNAASVGLNPTMVLWEHGQGNVADDQQKYKASVLAVFHEMEQQWGVKSPIFIAQDSMLSWVKHPDTVRTQREIAAMPGYALGPNIDLVPFRMDGTHMDDSGITIQAAMWFQTLAAYFKW
jgi:hypothetical protein